MFKEIYFYFRGNSWRRLASDIFGFLFELAAIILVVYLLHLMVQGWPEIAPEAY